MRLSCIVLILLVASNTVSGSTAPDRVLEELKILEDMSPLSATTFSPKAVARVVNDLRRLGSSHAVAVIKAFDKQEGQGRYNDELVLICRLVFRSQEGWRTMVLGEAEPRFDTKAASGFGDFSVVFSKGIPFFVVGGYRSNGRGESLNAYLELCKKLPTRAPDIPETGFAEAARVLTGSQSFSALYPDEQSRRQMSDLIRLQAAK